MNKRDQRIVELRKRADSFEKELISFVIADPSKISKIRTIISKEDFIYFGGQYENVLTSFLNDRDILLEFKQAGYSYTEFATHLFEQGRNNIRQIENIARDIKNTSSALNILTLLTNYSENVPDDNLDSFVSDVQKNILNKVSVVDGESSDIDSVIKEFKEKQSFYKDKLENGKGIIGIPTGYKKLDEIIDGLRPEHLWIIGGYANLGKTSASLNIVSSLVKMKKRVVFYSLEMSKTDILSKLVGIMTNQSGLTILKGFPHDEQLVEKAMEKISKSNMTVHNNKYDMDSIEFSMYDENTKSPVDLFVIDFLQLITVKGSRSEYETITGAILRLQQMAKRLKVPIIVLSQISNEGAKANNEVVMSFRGSGSIASAADLAIEIQIGEDDKVIWKTKLFNGEPVKMKWNIRKNRHGKVGFLDMHFTGFTGRFADADEKDWEGFEEQSKLSTDF